MNTPLWNLLQQGRGVFHLQPMGCLTNRSKSYCYGCAPGQYFECATCKKLQPYCKGASDDQEDVCDACYDPTFEPACD